jgi:hypothetical protein
MDFSHWWTLECSITVDEFTREPGSGGFHSLASVLGLARQPCLTSCVYRYVKGLLVTALCAAYY